jgi:hypothetical protein
VQGKATIGSTNPAAVDAALNALEAELAELRA